MKHNEISFEMALGTALLGLATIGTIKILFDMDRLGMYPWQSQTATVQAPDGCILILYKSPPPPGSPACKPTEATK
jgi:hypothetical protein